MVATFASAINRLGNVRVLLGLAAIFGVLSTQAGRGTLAFFTDTATSASNTFTTGTIDISLANGTSGATDCDTGLTYSDAVGAVLTATTRKPGDINTTSICVKNESTTLATRWDLSSTVSDDTSTATALESLMKIRIWSLSAADSIASSTCNAGFDAAGADATLNTGATELYASALMSTTPTIAASANTGISAGGFQKVCFSVVLPTSATDSDPAATTTVQGKVVTANFTFTGNQV